MPQGTLVRWDEDKGFGYLEPANGGREVFCHVSALVGGKGSARRGDLYHFKVTYDHRNDIELSVDAPGLVWRVERLSSSPARPRAAIRRSAELQKVGSTSALGTCCAPIMLRSMASCKALMRVARVIGRIAGLL